MAPRSSLQELLIAILGSANVYFQPPPSVQLKYPCILYNRESVNTEYADDSPYKRTKRYQVTVIDRNPDSEIPDKVGMLPLCSYDRFYTADNLNHDVFTLYF
jgi:hypothetical protein